MYQYLSYFDLYSQQIFGKPLEYDNLVMTLSSSFFFCSYKFNVSMFLNSKKLLSGTAREPVFFSSVLVLQVLKAAQMQLKTKLLLQNL